MFFVYFLLLLTHFFFTVWFYITTTTNSSLNYGYNLLITTFVILQIYQGFKYLKIYPELKKIIIPIQIGNALFAIALYIWYYYNITGQEIPYPGLPDLFFMLYYPATIYSLIQISKHAKSIWNFGSIVTVILFSITLAGASSFFLLNQAVDLSQSTLLISLNIIYPILDALLAAISIAILRSQTSLNQHYFFLFIFGFVFLGFADVLFAYQTNHETYWNGSVVDLFYGICHMSISLGFYFLPKILNLETQPKQVVSQNI